MYSLDLHTIILMSTLTGGGMAIVLYSMHRSFGEEVKGLDRCAMGLLAMVGGASMFGLRDVLPENAVLMAANGLLLLGLGLGMIAVQEFFGQPPGWRRFYGVWLCGFVGVGWWLLVVPNFPARVATFSFLVFIYYATQTVTVWRHGTRHFSTWFFGTLVTFQSLVVLVRGVAALMNGSGSVNMMRNSGLTNLFLATANFMSLMLAVGFMTMATRRLQTILEQRSTHDPLTGVLNRRGFGVFYERQRIQMRRSGRPLTLMSIDLDHFKAVNDRYGHVVGDRVLVNVARIVSQALRESDDVARFGGEEFVVLLPDAEVPRALLVAERIQAALRSGQDGALPPCTVSIGVASHVSEQESFDSLLARTDAALYRAKANGRDRVEQADLAETVVTAVPTAYAAGSGNLY
ncbi:MAG: GGDEF domain-containing protein [Pseudomonadota bacterium]